MRNMTRKLLAITLGLGMILGLEACGQKEEPAAKPADTAQAAGDKSAADDPYASAREFYAGKDIKVVCPQKAGGNNDICARLVATYMKDLLGAKSVTVENMDGGSGIICYNWLVSAADKDGTVFAVGSQPATNAIVNADPACQFGAMDFNYLGTIQEDYFCISANPDGPYADLDYVLNSQAITMASTAVTDAHTYAGVAALECMGIPDAKIIGGYGSVADGALAMEQGEVNLNASGNITALKNENEMPLFILAKDRDPSLPDCPTIYEVFPEMNGECRNLLECLPRNIKLILTNQGVPEDRVRFLEYCVDQMFADPQFAEDLKNQTGLTFTGGQNAEETTAVAQNYVDHKDDYAKWPEYVNQYIVN